MVLLHLDAFVGQNLTFSHQISVQLKTSEHFRAHFFVFRAQFLTKRRHFRPDPFLSCAERWQDLRAVRDSRGPCSEKGPFLARSSRGVSSNGDLRGISDAWRAYLAKASPFSDAWRANLAANWRFSRPRPLSGCMERKTCHGLTPGNAPRRNLATARHSRTHRARILPLPVARHAALSTWGSEFSPLAVLWGFGAQHFPCEGVDIPPSRGLTAGSDFESALFRWATMSSLRVLRSCAVLCAEAKSALTFI